MRRSSCTKRASSANSATTAAPWSTINAPLELAEEGLDQIHLDLAFEYENLEEYDDAIACLKNALELNPENEAVLYELAYCYDLAGADEACITFFRNFTNEQPYSSVSWYNLGNVFAKLERYEESNWALDLAIAIDERFSSAYFSKARNLLIGSKFEEAVACYEETLVFDGPQAITYSFIGECYEKMDRYEQALMGYQSTSPSRWTPNGWTPGMGVAW